MKNNILIILLLFFITCRSICQTQINQYNVHSIEYNLNVTNTSKYISGNLITSASVNPGGLDSIQFELHPNFIIDSVFVNNILTTNIIRTGNIAHVILNTPFSDGDFFEYKISYHGTAPGTTNTWGEGLVKQHDPTYNYDVVYSLSVPYHAHEWSPVKQVLTDLIDSVTMNITTDTINNVASNGLKIKDEYIGNGKHTVTWKTHYPINYYLISFVVGHYITQEQQIILPGETNPTLIQNFLYNDACVNSKLATLDLIDDMLINYSNHYGNYPFKKEKFGVIICPLGGGMEHQTLVNLSTSFDKQLAAHEMSHQWWGDNVNLVSLRDMWLNEGFATYSELITAENLYPALFSSTLNSDRSSAFTSANGRVYVDDTLNFNNLYNGSLVYSKGACIIRGLQFLINNDTLFFKGLSDYQHLYSGKNVTLQNFKNVMESVTGVDLSLFFNQWYYGYGYPSTQIKWDQQGSLVAVRSIQTTSSSQTPLFKTPFEIGIQRAGMPDTIIRVVQETNSDTFYFQIPQPVTGLTLDPNHWILMKLVGVQHDTSLLSGLVNPLNESSILFVYPNPFHDEVEIENVEFDKVEVYSMNKMLVKSTPLSKGTQELDLKQLPTGIYIFDFSKENHHLRRLILKN